MPLLRRIGKGLYDAYNDHSSSTKNHDDHAAYPNPQGYPPRPASSRSSYDGAPPPYEYLDRENSPVSRPHTSHESTLAPPQLNDRPHSQPPMQTRQQHPQPEQRPVQAQVQLPHLKPPTQATQFQTQTPQFNPQTQQQYDARGYPHAYSQAHPREHPPPHALQYRPQPYQDGPYGAYSTQIPYQGGPYGTYSTRVPYPSRYSDEYGDEKL